MSANKKARKSTKIETLAVHGGDQHDPGHGAIFPPITTATSFVQPNLGEERAALRTPAAGIPPGMPMRPPSRSSREAFGPPPPLQGWLPLHSPWSSCGRAATCW
ncbi:unnamed protein product [Effrenium voratum]|nr:unnamed protein product [Effrenium voratum]